LAYTLRTDAEVRQAGGIFGAVSDKAPDAAMISIAEKISQQQESRSLEPIDRPLRRSATTSPKPPSRPTPTSST
jgi:hypothetical protein